MKLNPNRNRQAGLTLIEITVVIAVLLGLIAVLFIGVQSYREATNKSRCIMQLSSIQKAVRSYANLNNLTEGAAITMADIVGPETGKLLATEPVCPKSGANYTVTGTVPAPGVVYASCGTDGHVPTDTESW